MAVAVETLEKLERKITITLPAQAIEAEVDARLKRLARTVKMDGFRPGKVPMKVVTQRYGYSVHYEVVNDKVGEAFYVAATEAKLRVAGQPRISEKPDAPEGELTFDAVFEVFPEVKFGDFSQVEVEKISSQVGPEAVDKALEILRKQRRTFAQRSLDAAASDGDRVTVDFEGKIDGDLFPGGQATDFQFLVGEGQMLKEFEDAVRGMKVGESKTFPLNFPDNYHGKEVAGKQADFMVTLKKLEASHLPSVDETLAKSLSGPDASVESLRADIAKNMEREVQSRLLARNKKAAIDALLKVAQLDLPQSIVQLELETLVDNARAELKRRGVKNADKAPIPQDVFRPQAEQRVRLGLAVSEFARANALLPKPEQIKTYIEEVASGYEKPDEVIRLYYSDKERLSGVEGLLTENNVTDFVLGKVKVVEKTLPFDELMG